MASSKKQAPVPGPVKPPRMLLGVGDELSGLSAELTRALNEDWQWSWGGNPGSVLPKSHEVYCRYGQRLRELQVEPAQALERVQREIDGLKEKTIREAHSRLAWLGSRIWQILDQEIPDRRQRRDELQEKVAGVHLRKAELRPFYWHRFLFLLLPAIALLAAEVALGEEITKTALRLQGTLWWLFPAALLALPLIFKEFLEWEGRSKRYRNYIVVLIVIAGLALVPLTVLRSQQAMRLVLPGRGGSAGVSNPFQTSSAPAPTAGAPSPRPAAPPPTGGETRSSLPLVLTFLFLGILFPMLSGLAFSRALEMADDGRESRKGMKQLERLNQDLAAVDAGISTHRSELTAHQQETVKLVEGLGDSTGFAEKVLAELCAVVQSWDEEAAAKLIHRIDELQPQSLKELSKRLAIEVVSLAGPRESSLALKLKHYTDLMGALAQIEGGKSLETLAKSKKDIVCASIREGYESLHNVAFAVVKPYGPEEKVQMVEDRDFYNTLFRRR